MILIAAPKFDAPSETFIRDHIRSIAPGETALLCLSEGGAKGFDLPLLDGLRPGWRSSEPTYHRMRNELRNRLRDLLGGGLPHSGRRRALNFITELRPSAVLAEYGATGFLLADICAQVQVPLYVHFHGYDASRQLRKPWWRRNYRRLFESAAGIIVPCRFLGKKLIDAGCPRGKLHVNACGVDAERFGPTRRLPCRFLAVGRLVEKKAPQHTIEAFARIADRFPQAKLDIVGTGPLAKQCAQLTRDLGLEDRICLRGAQNSTFVARLMMKASVFVQHSVTAPNGDCEGMPVAILEAMASELPVVSTRHSGIPEAVQDGVTGLLVEEHDVEGMAMAMEGLLTDPIRAEAMGKAGRRRVVEKFTQEQSRDRLRAIMGFPPIVPAAGDLPGAYRDPVSKSSTE